MKKQYILTILALMMSTTLFAHEWTDGNGTVWSFNVEDGKAILIKDGGACVSGTIPMNLTIPATVSDGESYYPVIAIGGSAFFHITNLRSISLPNTITSIGGYAFCECPNLTSINIPDGVSSIGEAAFGGCSSLTEITIPNGVTSIEYAAFSGCSSLTSINIPDGVTSIGNGAFSGCSSLTSINIPDGVTSIGDGTFSGCRSLEVTLPTSVCMISGFATFNDVQKVSLPNTTPPVLTQPELGMGHPEQPTVFCVPAEAKETYRTAENWSLLYTSIIGTSEWNDAEVDVTALEDGSCIQETIGEENLEDVYSLKVSGSINSYDIFIMRKKMPNLRRLDLTDATIVANDFEYTPGCHSENNVIGGFDMTKLYSVVLPSSLDRVADGAFGYCSNLVHVDMGHGVRTIGSGAFGQCYSLRTIRFAETLESIEGGAFGYAKIKELVLPKNLKSIGDGCFSENNSLTSIVFPASIEHIGSGAFTGGDMKIKTVTVATPEPVSILDGTFSNVSTTTLRVPNMGSSFEMYNGNNSSYYYANGWNVFPKLNYEYYEAYHPEYDNFYLNGDYEVGDGQDMFSGVDDQGPDANLHPGSGFIKEGEEDVQQLDDVEQDISDDGTSASIIAKDDGESSGNLNVNHLKVKIAVEANKWYFFCFPLDVTIAECTYPCEEYVWREYQGLLRATLGSGWKNVEGPTLDALNGYAFSTTAAGTLTIVFNQPKFGGNRPRSLEAHACEHAEDASWNFVGNPYSCYYDFHQDDFSAPITVWNGDSYVAYNPIDDDCHLRPYEAFFVQKPNDIYQIGFNEERRETYRQSEQKKVYQVRARRIRGLNAQRLLMNLYITNNNTSIIDRTRVVLNEKAQHAYELECDAAKFLSTSAAAQLYSVENGVQMAINERPQQGDIRLGYVAKNAGRLSIGAERLDQPMVLVDTQLGITFDLSLGTYDFDTQAGTFDGRFLLRAAGDQTGLTALRKQTGVVIGTQPGGIAIGGAEGKTVNVYTTGGSLANQHDGNGFIALKSGIYVVNIDGVSAKINVK